MRYKHVGVSSDLSLNLLILNDDMLVCDLESALMCLQILQE